MASRATIARRLTSIGARGEECGGGGECFPLLFAHSLGSPSINGAKVRSVTASHIFKHPELTANFIEGNDPIEYSIKMGKQRTFVEGDIEYTASVQGFADEEGKDIVLFVLGATEHHDKCFINKHETITSASKLVIIAHDEPGQHITSVVRITLGRFIFRASTRSAAIELVDPDQVEVNSRYAKFLLHVEEMRVAAITESALLKHSPSTFIDPLAVRCLLFIFEIVQI